MWDLPIGGLRYCGDDLLVDARPAPGNGGAQWPWNDRNS